MVDRLERELESGNSRSEARRVGLGRERLTNAPDGRRLGVESGSGCRHGQDVWIRMFVCVDSSYESRMYI